MQVSVEIKVDSRIEDITRDLAEMDNEVQAKFLNTFFNRLYGVCEGMHHLQLARVKKHLSEHTQEMLRELC